METVKKHVPLKQLRFNPAAKALARYHQIDLQDVPPTGKGHVITKEDVELFVANRKSTKEVAKA